MERGGPVIDMVLGILAVVIVSLSPVWIPELLKALKKRKAAKEKAHQPPDPQDELIHVIADVIRKDADSWEKTKHYWSHAKLKLSVWVANDDFGFGLRTDGGQAWPNGNGSNNIQLTRQQQKLLWAAVSEPLLAYSEKQKQEFAADIIERVISHYERVQSPQIVSTATTASSWTPVVHVGGTA